VYCGSKKKETKVKKKTLNPCWDETFVLYVLTLTAPCDSDVLLFSDVDNTLDTLQIKVKDWDRFSKSQLIGAAQVRFTTQCDSSAFGVAKADKHFHRFT
jgi:Ca2+-dependent lipid-binding protein